MYPGRTQGLRLLPPGQEKTVPKDGLFFASDQSKIADISQNAAPNANIKSEAMVLISFAFVFLYLICRNCESITSMRNILTGPFFMRYTKSKSKAVFGEG